LDKKEIYLLSFVPLSAVIISYFVIPNLDKPYLVLNYLTLAILIGFFPLFFYKFLKERKTKSLYEDIRQFFSDLTYYLKLGYSLKKSIELIYKNNVYPKEEFNKLIEKLYKKSKYNILDSFKEFINELNNPILSSFLPVIEHVIKNSEKIDTLFENIAVELEKELERQRKRSEKTYYVLLTSYVSFGIYILLIVLLIEKVINFQLGELKNIVAVFTSLIIFLVYEISLLSGFIIGSLVHNDFIEGVVHSLFFIGISFLIFLIIV